MAGAAGAVRRPARMTQAPGPRRVGARAASAGPSAGPAGAAAGAPREPLLKLGTRGSPLALAQAYVPPPSQSLHSSPSHSPPPRPPATLPGGALLLALATERRPGPGRWRANPSPAANFAPWMDCPRPPGAAAAREVPALDHERDDGMIQWKEEPAPSPAPSFPPAPLPAGVCTRWGARLRARAFRAPSSSGAAIHASSRPWD